MRLLTPPYYNLSKLIPLHDGQTGQLYLMELPNFLRVITDCKKLVLPYSGSMPFVWHWLRGVLGTWEFSCHPP